MASIRKYKNKYGQSRYEVTGYARFNSGNQKQVNFHKRGFRSNEEATSWAKNKEAELANNDRLRDDKSGMHIEEWMNDWLAHYKVNVKEGSMIIYRYNVAHYINPNIGKYRLGDYTPTVHQRFILDLLDHGGQDGEPLSYGSVNIINSTISNAFAKAVTLGYVRQNPTQGVEFPRSVKEREPQLHYYTREQAAAFLESAKDERDPIWYYFFLTILDLGLRKGEAMALQWNDIDFETNTIQINKTRLYRAETGQHVNDIIVDDPKFPASNRILYMSDRVHDALFELNNAFYPVGNILKLPSHHATAGGDDMVFRYSWSKRYAGLPIRDRSTNGAFERIYKRAGLPKIKIHDLRHTFGVFLRESGVSLEDIKDILGHKDISTTQIYAEITPHIIKSATKKYNRYIDPDDKKSPKGLPKSVDSTPFSTP